MMKMHSLPSLMRLRSLLQTDHYDLMISRDGSSVYVSVYPPEGSGISVWESTEIDLSVRTTTQLYLIILRAILRLSEPVESVDVKRA